MLKYESLRCSGAKFYKLFKHFHFYQHNDHMKIIQRVTLEKQKESHSAQLWGTTNWPTFLYMEIIILLLLVMVYYIKDVEDFFSMEF